MSSFWIDSTENLVNFNSLNSSLNTDVCIIGGGMFGLSTAYYLSKKGVNVTVLEKDFIGSKTSGYTTAKITSQHGLIYKHFIDDYGLEFAQKYLMANEQAINNIAEIVENENIDCDFERQSNFIYTASLDDLNKIENEISALKEINFISNFVTDLDVPFSLKSAIEFPNQAQFHPRKYMAGLCKSIVKNGGNIFENTTVFDVKKDKDVYNVICDKYSVTCKYVVLASHYPFINIPGFYFTKMYQDTSYVIAIDPKDKLFDGMFLSTQPNVFSFRSTNYNGKRLLLIGGAGHKTGEKVSYKSTYDVLEEKAYELYPNCEILYKWNTRDCITLDKIPYIGDFSNIMPNVFIGTGFNKWGMTSSNVAANIIADKILDISNQFEDVFNSTRMHPIKNRWEMKNIIKQSSNSLFFDKFSPASIHFDIENNTGKVVEINGEKVGIYKDEDGNAFILKPFCTHLGCLLSWNNVDKTWDCPCHGSRFDRFGHNIYDPAIKDLEFKKFNS